MYEDSAQKIVEKILQLTSLSDRLVLEIGCGDGRITSLLFTHTTQLVAIDPDPDLIRNLHQDSDETAVVNSMINLARRFKLEVTAAGVENAHQLDYLLSLGCHAAQGDYINPVIQVEQAEQLLSAEPEQPAALEM